MSDLSPDPDKMQELRASLKLASADLRENGDFDFESGDDEDEVTSTAELAKLIDTLAKKLPAPEAGARLLKIFAPSLSWDDAGGDPILGENIHQLVKELF